MTEVRVRFAPSNTGYLHIGGARTALYNWLYARQNNGKFVIRVEDTDYERSKSEFTDDILSSLKWLGIDWDEGPEFQTDRAAKGVYTPYINTLKANDAVYRCFCSKERLDGLAKEQEAKKSKVGYDRKCRELSKEEADKLEALGQPYVLRIKISAGHTSWIDGIQKEVKWNNRDLSDEIIVRSDGSPMYNFVVVCDDIAMGITHIIRGADHSSNTPKQLQIYRALGITPPTFSHIPLIFGPDGKKLSKRNPCMFQGKPVMSEVRQYREAGYLPEAVLNYLVLLGWGYDDHTEFFTQLELVEKFNITKVSPSPSRFDPKKLEHFQGVYVRNLSDDKFERILTMYLVKDGLFPDGFSLEDSRKIKLLAKAEKDRIRAFSEIAGKCRSIFSDTVAMDEEAIQVFNSKPEVTGLIPEYVDLLKDQNFEDAAALEQHARDFAKNKNVKFAEFVHPLRALLTGTTKGPKLFEILKICGKDVVLRRLSIGRMEQ